VLCDLLEERWFSMDLLADMLVENAGVVPSIAVERVRPALPAPLAGLATTPGNRPLERLPRKLALGWGRYVAYPFGLLARRARYDWFHVADHSYAHLALELPSAQTGVYCHDIDAFRPLFEEPTSAAHRALARTLLAGLRRARWVFHSTLAVRDDIISRTLVPADRLVHVPYGVAAEFRPEASGADAELARNPPFILHVGSLIPRKNPAFLLDIVVELCRRVPDLQVIQIGGRFSDSQADTLRAAGIGGRVKQIERLGRAELAPYYRTAKAVILPSTAEGFGLPVVEALACGTPVVASDLPVLAQVGGDAVVLCPVNDIAAWKDALLTVLAGHGPTRQTCLRVASRYTWREHARTILSTYAELGARGVS
jgi:glycosyltransferase involved in cell wall biosynthesis